MKQILLRILSALQSIRVQVLVLLLSVAILIAAILTTIGIDAIRQAGHEAQKTGSASMQAQVQTYLLQLVQAHAAQSDLVLQRAARDAENLAAYTATLLDDADTFAQNTYWRAEEKMSIDPDGRYINSPQDVTSIFAPNFIERDSRLLARLQATAYLDLLMPAVYESDPNIVAVYLGTENEFSRYYPNINLGEHVPPDFRVTQRPWYQSAAPEQNPERRTVWSQVYEEATGKSLLVTVAAPVYGQGHTFYGVIGIDLDLQALRDSIQKSTFATGGYLFLVDTKGRALALPEQGYQDLLDRSPSPEDTAPSLNDASRIFVARVLTSMLDGETGFVPLSLAGHDLYVAYTPLPSTGWSLGAVIESEQALATVNEMGQEIQRSTRALINRRVLPTVLFVLLVVGAVGLFISGRLISPLQQLAEAVQYIGRPRLDLLLPESGGTEIKTLTEAIRRTSHQVRELTGNLERLVAERTDALNTRIRHMETAADIAHTATRQPALGELFDYAVNMVSKQMGFYHVGIYVLGETGEHATLQAASSPAGRRMVAQQHRVRRGRGGIVSYVAHTGEAYVASDVRQDTLYASNPDLPGTQSEAAMPIRAGDQILGVLDIQSTQRAAFESEDITVLQTIADQIALAISNTSFREQARKRLQELQRAYGQFSREAWLSAERQGRPLSFRYRHDRTVADPSIWYPEMETALQTGQPVQLQVPAQKGDASDGERQAALAVPIQIHGETIGVLNIRKPPGAAPWTEDQVALARTVAEQLGHALETAQLYQETQRRAAREHLISTVTSRIRETLDIETVLQTALDELYAAFQMDELEIYLAPEAPDNGRSGGAG